ncbi:hypothetical protein PENTCL1PPCAC_16449, partial [Pristionchus entomophagus]
GMDPLRLGYFYLSLPGSTKYRHGIRGYDVDVFRSLAQSTGGTIPYEDEHSPFTGVLGQIENGSLFSFLDLNSLTPIRAKAFQMVLNRVDTFDLYGGIVSAANDEVSLHPFIVFAPSTIALIVVTMVFIRLP